MQIYIHIPFCEQKCHYCRFASVGNTQNFLIEKYVGYLCGEISRVPPCGGSRISGNPQGGTLQEVSTIYFGGGTPGVLTLEQLEKIFRVLKQKFIFSENIEITLESTPDRVTQKNIEGWKKLGFNRLSMGVQTLNQKSLEAIGRGNKGDIIQALENIVNLQKNSQEESRVLPIDISLDFIIGLPYVRQGEVLEDIQYILKNYDFVKHISVYMLEDYYSSDKITETKYDTISYPDDWSEMGIAEEEYLGEYTEVKNYLESQGFKRYEISNYAQRGYECKHNQGYWNHAEVLAFGLGAYGIIKNIIPSALHASSLKSKGREYEYIRYANSEKFGEYYQGKKILETKLSEEDIFLETVMFQLRTSGLEEKVYKKLNKEKLRYFIEEEYLEKKSDKIILLDKGVLVMDYILGEIIC